MAPASATRSRTRRKPVRLEVSDASLRGAGWVLCWTSVFLLLADVVVLAVLRPPSPQGAWWYDAAYTVALVGAPVLGALVIDRSPRFVYGWWWLGLGLAVGVVQGTVAATRHPLVGDMSIGWVCDLVLGLAYVGALVCLVHVLLLFPNGRPPTRRWRWVMPATLWAGTAVIMAMPFAGQDGALGTVLGGVVGIGETVLLCLVLVSSAASPRRWRGADAALRRQLTWYALGAAWFALTFVVAAWLNGVFPPWVHAILAFTQFAVLQLAIGIAMLRHGLYDVDRVINRALVYAVVSLCLGGVYVGVVVASSTVLAAHLDGVPQALATAVVALLVLPVRARVQRAVNQVMFGSRGDPYEVVTGLGRHLESAGDPEAVLTGIVESVAVTLRLPYVAITLRQDGEEAPGTSYGHAVAPPAEFPLTHQGEHLGTLLASPRSEHEDLTAPDRRLLADLARHAGVATHAFLLAADLRRSRSRVLATREEERRRLRRDLHDGLGPTLAAIALGLSTARRRLDDPARAASLLEQLGTELQQAIDEVRRIAHDLRPPVLDQFGLVEAIRLDARRFESDGAAGAHRLLIDVEAQEPLPSLPAAVEVAAYRIVGESLTNVVRHAGAHRCVIRLTCDTCLDLDITDDGCGMSADHRNGVGLSSIGERAAEVGGTSEITSSATGTQVRARLPLEAPT